VRAIQEAAEAEGRGLTADETAQVKDLIGRASTVNEIEALQRDLDGPGLQRDVTWPQGGSGLGDRFVSSEGYKSIQDPAARSQTWTTGAIELEAKATLTSTPGTALTPAGYAPGIVETLFQRPYLADLIPSQSAPGNPVRFVSETTATNAAAPTSEGGAKPESTLVFAETSEPVRKIATFLPISDELLEDAPQIQAYLNQRLTLFVKQVEESQLLLGSGTAPALQGFVASGRAIGTYARGTADDNATALFKAANGTRGSSFLDPDTVVIHPTNWQAIRLGKDNSGQYYGGGPFYGAYGGNTPQASSSPPLRKSAAPVAKAPTNAVPTVIALLTTTRMPQSKSAANWAQGRGEQLTWNVFPERHRGDQGRAARSVGGLSAERLCGGGGLGVDVPPRWGFQQGRRAVAPLRRPSLPTERSGRGPRRVD
jgi:HK97 family phage major capsid protein